MKKLVLPHEWTPRDYQKPLWDYLSKGGKRAVTAWHRRSGKDDTFLHHTACAAMERVGNYWYMLPEYSQARKSMWDAINPKTSRRRIDDAFPEGMRSGMREQEMSIRFTNGSTFQLVGSDNFDSLVGSPPVGLVFSEYAISSPNAWGYLMPILEENGGWAGFNSTPRGKNHFKRLLDLARKEPGWFWSLLTADDTGVFNPDQLQAILRQLQAEHGDDYGKALWDQEYFCSFDCAVPGSIWGDCLDKAQREGRITKVVHQEGFPVFTAWDLGYDDDTACWFYQIISGEIRIIDYFDDRLKDIAFYADTLKARSKKYGYQYGTHWLPHDARPRTLAAGGKSIMQQLFDHDIGRIVIVKKLDVEEGIQAARATFPKCWFDEEKCEKGLDYLWDYKRSWDDEKKILSSMPVHDAASHAADAFRALSLSWKLGKDHSVEPTFHEKLMTGSINSINYGQLKKDNFNRKRSLRQEI